MIGVVQRRPILTCDLDHVLESLVCDQCRPGPLAFKQGVGCNGCAVNEQVDGSPCCNGLSARRNAIALDLGRRDLRRCNGIAIDEHEIGERTSDIRPEDHL